MLTDKEIKLLHDFKDSLSMVKQKELLNQLLFEYAQYRKCGTPEDCQQRKEWMEMSIEDIRENFNGIVKGLRDEVKQIRKEAEKSERKKRGRPRKEGNK